MSPSVDGHGLDAEERLRLAAEAVALAFWEIDLDSATLAAEAPMRAMHGLAAEAPLDVAMWLACIDPEDRAAVTDALGAAPQATTLFRVRYRVQGPATAPRHIECTGRMSGLADGRIVGVCRDLTERTLLEEAMQESLEKTRRILDAADVGLWEWDIASDEVYFSPEWKRQLGYAEHEITNHFSEWERRAHPDDLPPVKVAIADVLEGRSPRYAVELRLRHRDGSWRWIYGEADLERDGTGRPVRMRGSQIDITRRKQAEEALRNSERHYRVLFDASPVPLALNDADGRILALNAAFVRTFGYTREDLPDLAAWWPKAYPDATYRHWVASTWFARLAHASTEGKPFDPMELDIRCKDGSRRTAEVGAIALSDTTPAQTLVVLYDITDRKRAEQALREAKAMLEDRVAERTTALSLAKDRAEAANRAKSEFLANMSHELRTPLHSILGFAKLIEEDLDDSEAHALFRRHADRIIKNGTQLLGLIDDLLDSAKVDAGSFTLQTEPAELTTIIRTVVEAFPVEEGSGTRFALSLPEACWSTVDPLRTAQVVRNLVANAIRYSPPDEEIEVVLAMDPTAGTASLSIADRGPGIPEAELERIFDRFVQSSKTTTGAGGSGLGLTIARAIMNRQGGSLKAHNRPGGGACFVATFALRDAPA